MRPLNRLVTPQNTFRRVKESFHPEITTSCSSSGQRYGRSAVKNCPGRQAGVVVAARIRTPLRVARFRSGFFFRPIRGWRGRLATIAFRQAGRLRCATASATFGSRRPSAPRYAFATLSMTWTKPPRRSHSRLAASMPRPFLRQQGEARRSGRTGLQACIAFARPVAWRGVQGKSATVIPSAWPAGHCTSSIR